LFCNKNEPPRPFGQQQFYNRQWRHPHPASAIHAPSTGSEQCLWRELYKPAYHPIRCPLHLQWQGKRCGNGLQLFRCKVLPQRYKPLAESVSAGKIKRNAFQFANCQQNSVSPKKRRAGVGCECKKHRKSKKAFTFGACPTTFLDFQVFLQSGQKHRFFLIFLVLFLSRKKVHRKKLQHSKIFNIFTTQMYIYAKQPYT